MTDVVDPSSQAADEKDTSARRVGRRAIMFGGAAAGVGAAVSLVGGAEPASAQDGDPILMGEVNSCTATTQLTNTDGGGALAGFTQDNNSVAISGYGTGQGGGGVQGIAGSAGTGVLGLSAGVSNLVAADTVAGVIGDSSDVTGVIGASSGSNGVEGITSAGGQAGTLGNDTSSTGGYGVQGVSTHGVGIHGESVGTSAIESMPLAGVVGDSDTNDGVLGLSSAATGTSGATSANGHAGTLGNDLSQLGGYGVLGKSTNGSGVWGAGGTNGYGVQASGGLAQLRLVPASTKGHPTAGSHQVGELFLDKTGELYLCKKAGTPGTWTAIS